MKESSPSDDLVRDEIIHLPLASIDPDPDQPRLDVDADLADSIKQHGVLQAIEVRPHPVDADRWMLVDGERRYQGAKAARLETIPATIKLDVEDAADRIVRQIVRNEGKPLTPVEEALAFKKIIDARHAAGDTKFGVVQLARELGIAKSTIGDRLALTEIPAFWLEPIAQGPLQASQAPILHRWRKVPEKYQRIAFEQMKKDYRWPGADSYSKAKKGERIYNRELETLIRQYFPKFVKPVADVPGYQGPTESLTIETHIGKKVYAMDPSQWGPIWRKGIAARRSKDAKKKPSAAARREPEYDWQAEQRKREEKRKAWLEALPGKLDAVIEALSSGRFDDQVRERLTNLTGAGVQHDRHAKPLLEHMLVSRVASAEEFLRFLAFRDIVSDVTDQWTGEREWKAVAKDFGLERDPKPATAPAARGEKKRRGKNAAAEIEVPAESAPDPADVSAPACKYCECTEASACELEDGSPCSWYDRSVPVCGNPDCVSAYQEDVESAPDAGDESDELEEVAV